MKMSSTNLNVRTLVLSGLLGLISITITPFAAGLTIAKPTTPTTLAHGGVLEGPGERAVDLPKQKLIIPERHLPRYHPNHHNRWYHPRPDGKHPLT